MASETSRQTLESMGVRATMPEEGLEILERLLAGRTVQATVVDVDWKKFVPVFQARAARPFFDRLSLPAAEEAGPGRSADVLLQLQSAITGNRIAMLQDWVADDVCTVLGSDVKPEADQPFSISAWIRDLGRCRLLETRFGCSLPPTLAFDYPTVARLAGYLLQELKLNLAADAPAAPVSETEDSFSRVAELSDEEVDRLFAEKVLRGTE
jgi:hypothetical protein